MSCLEPNKRDVIRSLQEAGAGCSPGRIGMMVTLGVTTAMMWGALSLVHEPAEAQSSPATSQRVLEVGLSPEQFQQAFNKRLRQRFAPLCLDTHYAQQGQVVIGVVWEKRAGGQLVVRAGLSRNKMKEAVRKQAADGYRLTWMTATGSGGPELYSAVWEKAPGQQLAVRYGYPLKDITRLHEDFAEKGYVLHNLMPVEDQKAIRFTAVWERNESADRQWQANLTSGAFLREVRQRSRLGYRLRQAIPYVDRRGIRMVGVWEKNDGPEQQVRLQLTPPAVSRLNEEMRKQGYRPALAAGVSVNATDRYLVVWEKLIR